MSSTEIKTQVRSGSDLISRAKESIEEVQPPEASEELHGSGDVALVDVREQHEFEERHIDGAILTIGGKWHCRVRGDHADPRLVQVMKLFTGMIVFNRQARRHVKALARDIHDGRIKPDIQRQEADLYMNPRRIR